MTLKEIINVLRTATDISEIMAVQENILRIFPIMRTTVNYDQRNYAHQYDLWNHSIHTVLNLPRNNEDDMLYLGALLHDIGKPLAQCRGKNPDDPYMHYYGHPEISKSLIQSSVIPELQKQGVQLSLDEKHCQTSEKMWQHLQIQTADASRISRCQSTYHRSRNHPAAHRIMRHAVYIHR